MSRITLVSERKDFDENESLFKKKAVDCNGVLIDIYKLGNRNSYTLTSTRDWYGSWDLFKLYLIDVAHIILKYNHVPLVIHGISHVRDSDNYGCLPNYIECQKTLDTFMLAVSSRKHSLFIPISKPKFEVTPQNYRMSIDDNFSLFAYQVTHLWAKHKTFETNIIY